MSKRQSDKLPVPYPACSHLQPSGTFKTRLMEKPPLKAFRVQSERDGSTLNYGEYDTLEMARAGACGIDAVILTRESNAKNHERGLSVLNIAES